MAAVMVAVGAPQQMALAGECCYQEAQWRPKRKQDVTLQQPQLRQLRLSLELQGAREWEHQTHHT